MPHPYHYAIVIDGLTCAVFSEVHAVDFSTTPIEYREGSSPVLTFSTTPGLRIFGSITLKLGHSTDKGFADWIMESRTWQVERKTITIQIMDSANRDATASWEVVRTWPPNTVVSIFVQMQRKSHLRALSSPMGPLPNHMNRRKGLFYHGISDGI